MRNKKSPPKPKNPQTNPKSSQATYTDLQPHLFFPERGHPLVSRLCLIEDP